MTAQTDNEGRRIYWAVIVVPPNVMHPQSAPEMGGPAVGVYETEDEAQKAAAEYIQKVWPGERGTFFAAGGWISTYPVRLGLPIIHMTHANLNDAG